MQLFKKQDQSQEQWQLGESRENPHSRGDQYLCSSGTPDFPQSQPSPKSTGVA